MAEVIQEAIENTPYWIPGDPGTHQDPYVNAAEALTAAGYGPVREAKEAAWDECESANYEIRLEPGGRYWQPYKDNPYRATP